MSNSTGSQWKVGDRVTLKRAPSNTYMPRSDTAAWMYGASATIKTVNHYDAYSRGAQTLLVFDPQYRGYTRGDLACGPIGYIVNTAELIRLRPKAQTSHSTWLPA